MKKLFILLLLAAAFAAGYWYYVQNGEDAAQELKLYGNVDIREVELSFRVPGRLAQVNVDEGDAVQRGEVLAVLDDRPYRDAVAKAMGDRDVAAANLAKYLAGNRAEDIAQARAQVANIAAQVKNAEALARRLAVLLGNGAISAQEHDDAVASRDALTAQLKSARKALQLQNAGYRDEDKLGAEAGLRAAEAAVAAATTDLDDTRLFAPSKGTVLTRVREPGAMAEAGGTVLVVSLDSPVWVRAYVPETRLGEVRLGMPVQVTTDGKPDSPYHGSIGFISPVAEFTPKNVETEAMRTALVYRLRIVVHDADEALRQGMPVTVRAALDKEEAASAPPAPPSATPSGGTTGAAPGKTAEEATP